MSHEYTVLIRKEDNRTETLKFDAVLVEDPIGSVVTVMILSFF